MRLFSLLLLLFLSVSASAQYRLTWDATGSATVGAENTYSVNHGLHFVIDEILPHRITEERRWDQKLAGIGYRLAKMALADAHVDLTMHLIQHEFFGHGARLREFDFINNTYEIFPYPPYGPGGGRAYLGRPIEGRMVSDHEWAAMYSGGSEAAAVMAQKVRRNWLLNGQVNYSDWLLYTAGLLDLTGYIYTTRWFTPGSGNDVVNYTRTVNEFYGFSLEEQWALTYQDLERRSLINLVNTYQLLAIYTFLKTYLLDGESATELPMLRLGAYRYLPAFRFGMTPFGTEWYSDHDFLHGDRLYQFYLRFGSQDFVSSPVWGAGLQHYRPISKRLQIQVAADLWNQPSLTLGGAEEFRTNEGLGGRLAISCDYKVSSTFPIGLYAQVGGKSTGFLPGETLDAGFIWRLGLSYVPE